jgi:CubicO group peptidase (beta-lactamase class C family)
LYSTVDDLSKFVAFEIGFGPESILKKQTLEEARKYLVLTDLLLQGYGVGLEASWHGEYLLQGHGGSVPGYNSAAYFEPQRKLGVLFSTHRRSQRTWAANSAFRIFILLVMHKGYAAISQTW